MTVAIANVILMVASGVVAICFFLKARAEQKATEQLLDEWRRLQEEYRTLRESARPARPTRREVREACLRVRAARIKAARPVGGAMPTRAEVRAAEKSIQAHAFACHDYRCAGCGVHICHDLNCEEHR